MSEIWSGLAGGADQSNEMALRARIDSHLLLPGRMRRRAGPHESPQTDQPNSAPPNSGQVHLFIYLFIFCTPNKH